MKRLVIGILAHVDSGKTTLSEGMLYTTGTIKKWGRVDHKDTFFDTDSLERERGITIFSKQAQLSFDDLEVTLLDTPGHVDFSPEMERTLQVLDYAILVISGTDGVQSHTETLWRLLARHRIPTFLFINKMDLPGASREGVLEDLHRHLDERCVDFTHEPDPEALALCDEHLLDAFLETGELPQDAICQGVGSRKIFPCAFGSALKLKGVDRFLELLSAYTVAQPAPEGFGARVYKITHDEQQNRLTHIKVTSGVLRVKDVVSGETDGEAWEEKVNQLRIYAGNKYKTTNEVLPGMICAVTGLSHTRPGDGLGILPAAELPQLEPVLNYRVNLPDGMDPHTALGKFRRLEEEEPELHVQWNERSQEIHVQLMGEVQLEILKRLLDERYGMTVSFDEGRIVYRETIEEEVEGVGHFEPLRHYAEVHLLLSPAPRGSGMHFSSSCSEDVLDRNWQRLILSHLEEKVHLGVLTNSPITDLNITLAAGRAHLKHTEGGDFRQATYRAVRQGLRQAKSILLEPWYAFRLEVPQESIGRAISDLQRLSATFDAPDTVGDRAVLTGKGPVATLQHYPMEVISYTHGLGRFTCTLAGYEPCHNAEEVIATIGYQPDTDLDNTADSVFCAHGAGFAVKWDEVPRYMHLPSVLEKPKEETAPAAPKPMDYRAVQASEKELAAIFERTYGPIRKEPKEEKRPARRSTELQTKTKAAPLPSGPEYLLVDGYNIIFAWDDLKDLARDNLEAARTQLIQRLSNYQGYSGCKLIVVFDAYKVKGGTGSVERHQNLYVVYTKEAETADQYIEKATHDLSKRHRVRVATSDGMEQLIILGNGALRVSARSFLEEVQETERAIRKQINS
jgi:small GTP-binding protein